MFKKKKKKKKKFLKKKKKKKKTYKTLSFINFPRVSGIDPFIQLLFNFLFHLNNYQ